MVYAAVRDVDPVYGLGSLLRGDKPESRTPGGPKDMSGSGTVEFPGPMGTGTIDFGAGTVPKSATVLVQGIRVNKSITGAIGRLLTAAKAAGFTSVSGHGWRSLAEQRALRRLRGYTSDSQPSGSGGRVPVAIPGTSMHEKGLAIDFTNHGQSLTRSDPFFTWLARNAANYGLRNLSSEPWHWSTNGH